MKWFTYTWELDAAVTALGCGTLLLEVEVTELATWSPDNADLVGGRVVPVIEISVNALMPHSLRSSLWYRMATTRRGYRFGWAYGFLRLCSRQLLVF